MESRDTGNAMSDLPADFDPIEYLRLHHDVAAAKLDAGYHYLKYGRIEGRPYKDQSSKSSIEHMETMVLTKPSLFRERLGVETLLVTGAARGATSLVAYALMRLGYPLSADDPQNHEMREMMDALNSPAKRKFVIERENSMRARWGFKLPAASQSLDWYVTNLRAPIIAMVVRNPVAIARSVQSRDAKWDKGETGLAEALHHAERHVFAARAAVRSPAPAVFIDVDLAQRKAALFVQELATLFNLPNNGNVAGEISTPGYKQIAS